MLDSRNSDRGRHVRSWGDVPNVAAYDINKWNISDMWKMSLQITPYVYASTYIKNTNYQIWNCLYKSTLPWTQNWKRYKWIVFIVCSSNLQESQIFSHQGVQFRDHQCSTYTHEIKKKIPSDVSSLKWDKHRYQYMISISQISKTPPKFKLPQNKIILSRLFYDVPN